MAVSVEVPQEPLGAAATVVMSGSPARSGAWSPLQLRASMGGRTETQPQHTGLRRRPMRSAVDGRHPQGMDRVVDDALLERVEQQRAFAVRRGLAQEVGSGKAGARTGNAGGWPPTAIGRLGKRSSVLTAKRPGGAVVEVTAVWLEPLMLALRLGLSIEARRDQATSSRGTRSWP